MIYLIKMFQIEISTIQIRITLNKFLIHNTNFI